MPPKGSTAEVEQHATLFSVLILSGAILALTWLYRRDELFVLSVKRGKLLTIRGALPAGLQNSFSAILKEEGIQRASLRAVKQDGGTRLQVWGIDEGAAQRLRNVFSLHHLSKLRQARRNDGRNLGQILGIASLAWWIHDSFRR